MGTDFATTVLKQSSSENTQAISLGYQAEYTKGAVKSSTVTLLGDQSFLNQPVGTFQGVIDYTLPADAPALDYIYWFRNRFPEAGKFSQYNLGETVKNIAAAKAAV